MSKSDRFKPWEPRCIVFEYYKPNDYKGTPFKRFKPETDYRKTLAEECARSVNAKIRAIMHRSRTGKI